MYKCQRSISFMGLSQAKRVSICCHLFVNRVIFDLGRRQHVLFT